MEPNQIHNEQELLLRIAEGDEKAFRVLFDQYWEPLYAATLTLVKAKEPARDLLQEVFLKIWNVRTELPGKENVKNFIFIVARNHIYNELRKKSHEEAFSENIIRHFAEKSDTALEQLIHKEARQVLNEAVSQLPEQQRLVYQLSREQGLSQQEIASRLQISLSTVKTHMSRALSAIRDYILQQAHVAILLQILVGELF